MHHAVVFRAFVAISLIKQTKLRYVGCKSSMSGLWLRCVALMALEMG
jgi:hypothetical protein